MKHKVFKQAFYSVFVSFHDTRNTCNKLAIYEKLPKTCNKNPLSHHWKLQIKYQIPSRVSAFSAYRYFTLQPWDFLLRRPRTGLATLAWWRRTQATRPTIIQMSSWHTNVRVHFHWTFGSCHSTRHSVALTLIIYKKTLQNYWDNVTKLFGR